MGRFLFPSMDIVYFMIAVVLVPDLCYGWGSDGHRVISKIALDLVGNAAHQFLTNLVDDGDFIEWSLWPDTPIAEARYPDSSNYHFSHTPYRKCAVFDFTRDCGFRQSGLCLVSGVSRFLSIIVDPYRPREERQDALKFILHLVGDIHQPLHTGFREDAGGTLINVTTTSSPDIFSLHEVFDYGIIGRYKAVMTPPHWESIAAKSVTLIQRNPSILSRYLYLSDLDQYLESTEMMMEYAASIVSEMTTSVTCNYAYRNENGTYIENNDELSESYYKSRTAGVMTLLVKAGVRLAKLLDAVAIEYNVRKSAKEAIEYEERIARAIARLHEPAPAAEPRPDSNRYAILAIDCDPETLVEDDDEETVATPTSPAASSPRVSSPVQKKLKVSKIPPPSPILYEGIDLDSIILIRRKDRYMVTDRRLVTSYKYIPPSIIGFNVRFNTTGEVKFYFDMTVFPHTMSDELAVRTILKLNGIRLNETESIASYVNGTSLSRDQQYQFSEPTGSEHVRPGFVVSVSEETPEARQAKVDLVKDVHARLKAEHAARQSEIARKFASEWSREFSSIGLYMESRLKAQRNQVVVITHDRLKMFVLADTLKRPVTERCRFNFIPIQTLSRADGGIKAGLLIDPSLFEGLITGEIARILQTIERSNKSLSRRHRSTRPTLDDELSDIHSMFYGTDPDRMMKRKVLLEFMVYPGDDLSRYLVFEWALSSTMFDPA